MAFRVDKGAVLRSPVQLPDGAWRIDATLTRTGVFVYRDAQGNEFREYRPAEEVFDDASLNSFEGVVITDDHPPVMVNAQNVSEFKRGRVGSVKRDGKHMVGSLIIEDAGLLAKMKSGKIEISNGYSCELEMTPGVSPDGEKYDAIQRNIRGNHSAVVDAGRAGTARAKMDRFDAAAVQIDDSAPTSGTPAPAGAQEQSTGETRKDSTVDLKEALAKIDALTVERETEKRRANDAEGKLKEAETKLAQSEAKADAAANDLKAAKDAQAAADKARTDVIAAQPAAVKARVQLVGTALAAGVTSIKVDSKDVGVYDAEPRAVKLAVIAKIDGVEVPAEKRDNDAYVDARFDLASAKADQSKAAFNALNPIVNNEAKHLDNVDGDDKEAKARAKMMQDSRDAHKQPLSTTAPEVK